MRIAIYARFSSDLQREASIEDQVRVCKGLAERLGGSVVQVFSDYGISGATNLRPGFQQMLADGRAGAFDVLVAEALDRLSRDQEHVAALFKQLSFAGIRIITLAEGEISELHVGLKGTMNALFLKDLRAKVKRGMEGRIRAGKSGGGLAYGYRTVRRLDTRGELVRGDRTIHEAEAVVVRRIFAAFADGSSPRQIARDLNREGVPGPGDRPWCDTMIRGHRLRRCGILHNVIYAGRLVWNRQSFIKDPQTGKRIPRHNPESEWIVQDVPEMRIVDEATWDRVQDRLVAISTSPGVTKARAAEFWRRRRPRHLLTGLVFCGACGSPMASSGRHYLSCGAARRQGTCDSRRGIARTVLEDLILSTLQHHLLAPEYVEEFVAAYHAQLNELRHAAELAQLQKERELDRVERQLAALIDSIAEGLRSPGLQARLDELENRKATLARELSVKQLNAPRLHPNLASVYADRVAHLHEALADPTSRDEALAILRSLIERVVVRPAEHSKAFEIELVGEIANCREVSASGLLDVG